MIPLSHRWQASAAWTAGFTALSWLGEVLHNRVELPDLSLLSPENSLPGLVAVALYLLWWRFPARRSPKILLLAWALLHLAGGAFLSVIPFRFLPFYPEQTPTHYLAHVIYGLAQLPLIWMIASQIQRKWTQGTASHGRA